MTNGANIGTQGVTWAILGGEAFIVLYDLRWMLVFMGILILADFWWGSKEAWKRYELTGDDRHKWRFSRAGRRSLNKVVDYLTYLLIGATLGMAIFEPIGVCNHITSSAVGLGLGSLFDMSSIIGHICFIHDIDTKGGIHKILFRIFVAFVKKKNAELGESIEEGVNDEGN